MSETELVPVPCRLCKAPVAVELPADGEFFREELERVARLTAVHNRCYDENEGRLKAAATLAWEKARMANWNKLCPDEFKKELNFKKKACNRNTYDRVMAWRVGENNLLLRGSSGKCKTRFAWKLLEREWNAGYTMAAHTHTELRMTLTSLASNDQPRCNVFVEQLSRADILFIDDLGKGRATPASEEAFFCLLDARMRDCKPTLFTSDLPLTALDAVWSDAYACGTMRRILERCEKIEF